MDNAFDEVTRAVRAARELNQTIDRQANQLAELLHGRLRHVEYTDYLRVMKAELQRFDSRSGKWKD